MRLRLHNDRPKLDVVCAAWTCLISISCLSRLPSPCQSSPSPSSIWPVIAHVKKPTLALPPGFRFTGHRLRREDTHSLFCLPLVDAYRAPCILHGVGRLYPLCSSF
ncbi:hypothetical protein K402DRAFT_152595 [Aulographum hederae CBS 113979]|uniref:Uncharacterized protein n=1 Tax=Aulographum hederae CBS 113979 TaxID=1176131 RepID=A0A6G1GT17_9PEZI|nr:hypothetical protein K402DRAFT_152595 [Aulographum hederae CBS 113979]